ERVADGGHAAGEAGSGLGAFEVANLLLERGDGGVGVAAIDVPSLFTERDFEPLFDRFVAIRDAQCDRNLRRAHPALSALSRPDGAGAESRRVLVFWLVHKSPCPVKIHRSEFRRS